MTIKLNDLVYIRSDMSTVILGSALRGLRFLFRLSIVSRISLNVSTTSSAISGSGFDAVLRDHSGIQKNNLTSIISALIWKFIAIMWSVYLQF